MSSVKAVIGAAPEAVWAVLADPFLYPCWVVGAKQIRDASANWPEAESVFHHTVGVGPLSVDDHTKSCVADAPHRLLLDARARPFGRAGVDIVLRPCPEGTEVQMSETMLSPRLAQMLGPILDPLVSIRNTESLRRLRTLAVAWARSPRA